MENYHIQSESVSLFTLVVIGSIIGSASYFIIERPPNLLRILGRYLWYSPGVGSVTLEKKGRNKFGVVETEIGNMRVPIMKMSSFENVYGFFRNSEVEYPLGVTSLDQFKSRYGGIFPNYESLKTIGDNLILNYRRPKDFNGKNQVYGFIRSDIDDLVFVYLVENNNIIDYEEMDKRYIEYIENSHGDYDVDESVDFLKQEEKVPGDYDVDDSVDFLKQEEKVPGDYDVDDSVDFLKQGEKGNDISPDDKSDNDFFNISRVCVGDTCSTEYGFDRQYRIDDPEFSSCMEDDKKEK